MRPPYDRAAVAADREYTTILAIADRVKAMPRNLSQISVSNKSKTGKSCGIRSVCARV